jgi:site-specific recombinase XerD
VDADALADGLIADGLSNKTIACYVVTLNRLDDWLASRGFTIDDVGPALLRQYGETLPLTRSSRSALRSACRAYWRVTGRADGPGRAIRVPSKGRMRCLALDDVPAARLAREARARVAAGDRKGLAVVLGLYTGLRRAELASLRWDQIGDDGWVTIVGKGLVTRTLPLHPHVLEALRAFAGHSTSGASAGARPLGSDWIFQGRWDGPVNPTTLWGWVREVAADAGVLGVRPHILRHTALSAALDNTKDLRAVQELAGHARPETTAGYTRVRRNRLVEAVRAIDYGELGETA